MSLRILIVLMHGTLVMVEFVLRAKTATISYHYREEYSLGHLVVQRRLLSLKQMAKQKYARPVSNRQNIVRSVTSKPEFVLNVRVPLQHLLSS
jgi:hypothetical protein